MSFRNEHIDCLCSNHVSQRPLRHPLVGYIQTCIINESIYLIPNQINIMLKLKSVTNGKWVSKDIQAMRVLVIGINIPYQTLQQRCLHLRSIYVFLLILAYFMFTNKCYYFGISVEVLLLCGIVVSCTLVIVQLILHIFNKKTLFNKN